MDDLSKRPGWLFILPWGLRSIGGVNTVVKALIKEVNEDAEYRPILIVSDWKYMEPTVFEFEDYIEIRYRLYPIDFSSVKSFLSYVAFFRASEDKYSKIIKDYNIKVVNAHYPTLSLISLVVFSLIRKGDLKVFLSFHGMDLESIKNDSYLNKKLWKLICCRVDAIVTCSRGLKAKLLKEFHSLDNVKAIHNGVNLQVLRSNIRDAPQDVIKLPEKTILSVGTFEEKKGQETLIKAFSELSSRASGWSLVLVGRDGPCLQKYKKLVDSLSISDRVYFYVNIPIESMPEFYTQSNIFVSPSNIEPFGLVMLEAAMFDLPVIATRTDGAVEIISDGVDGVLVDIGCEKEMSDSLLRLINSSEESEKLVTNLKLKAHKKFQWSDTFKKYKKLSSQ